MFLWEWECVYRVAETHRSPKLQIIFHERATKCKSLLRKMTCKDKGSYEPSPPCIHILTLTETFSCTHSLTLTKKLSCTRSHSHRNIQLYTFSHSPKTIELYTFSPSQKNWIVHILTLTEKISSLPNAHALSAIITPELTYKNFKIQLYFGSCGKIQL